MGVSSEFYRQVKTSNPASRSFCEMSKLLTIGTFPLSEFQGNLTTVTCASPSHHAGPMVVFWAISGIKAVPVWRYIPGKARSSRRMRAVVIIQREMIRCCQPIRFVKMRRVTGEAVYNYTEKNNFVLWYYRLIVTIFIL